MRIFLFGLIMLMTVLTTGCALLEGTLGMRGRYEEPKYEVVDTLNKKTEVRRYESRLVAEATVPIREGKDPDDRAFMMLFDYISGENEADQKIAMTVPVETERRSEKIAMTVPVEVTKPTTGTSSMRFFFPSKYTMETAPKPLDKNIALLTLPQQEYAVYTIKGWTSDKEVNEKKGELLALLDEASWQATGQPTVYYYDPPFTIPFFRKTEVLVPVSPEE